MISVGLFGFGKTGKIIAQELINENTIELKWVVRKSLTESGEFAGQLLGLHKNEGEIFSLDHMPSVEDFLVNNPVDIVIDFSNHETIRKYYHAIKSTNSKLISAISNYPAEELQLINELAKDRAVLYSPNITLGINFLIVISQVLQKIVPWADIEIIEEHFRNKPDISGTAVRIADILGLDRNNHINSVRIGGIVGKHEVLFGLPNQTIRLTHETNNRAAFGQGIIFGAKYLHQKGAGRYSMDQIIKEKFVTSINDELAELTTQ
ncbi:MAG TPA: dihydrodipicolinate reductase C-terminal domain-containing protein [Flavipsychrobacter sp.]